MQFTLIGFIVLIAFGVPIAFVLGLITLISIATTGNMAMLYSLPSRMFSSTLNFGLVAIPLFILVGELMNYGGITRRLINFCTALLGHVRGGLAYVNVLANAMAASIMGSANAQIAVMSKVMVPEMERQGYKKDFSTALTVSSSVMGPLIPPSMPFILFAVTANGAVSIAALFIAGIIPGILFGIAFAILVSFFARKHNFPKSERVKFSVISKSFLNILPAMIIPGAIIIGIMTGAFTATESAAIASLVAILVGFFLYKELKLKDIPKILINTTVNSAIVTFLVATASIFGWILTFEQIPQLIADYIMSIVSGPMTFLLVVNIFLLLVGMFMEGAAAMIILVPILMPVALSYGIDPLHFGVIVVVNLTIGILTPPVGTGLFIASSIVDITLERLIKSVIPFLVAALIVLLIITYIPSISTWIPSQMTK
ncbi:TRAP transporter large permease [Sporosarcina siberiensis]|uniref:TRAP transporter large permease n=1 Tax=Sporosarcina siberiensis TaxID=1365606 RepID=A0ABW4SL92_9BACL